MEKIQGLHNIEKWLPWNAYLCSNGAIHITNTDPNSPSLKVIERGRDRALLKAVPDWRAQESAARRLCRFRLVLQLITSSCENAGKTVSNCA